MIKKKLFFLWILILGGMISAQNFEKYFENEAMRVDFLFTTDGKKEILSIKKIKKEPYFGGSNKNLIFPDYGNFRLVIKDFFDKKVIFRKGFNPLYHEWKTLNKTNENVSFENFLQFPFPKNEIIFQIEERQKNGVFKIIFSKKISPKDKTIIKENPQNFQVKEIYKNAPSEKAIDLVIVAEGYTQEEMPKFQKDAKRLVDYLFSIPPFDEYDKNFNVYAVESFSQESGTDFSGEGIFKNTILDTHFYTFDSPRYLTCPSLFKLGDLVSLVPYDQIYILVNTKSYGGGGFYNVLNIVSADNELSDKVFVHEFGHGFVGLADEYYYENDIFTNSYDLSIEPWEANITTLKNFQSKWKNMVKKNTPIPTPREEKYKNEVGAFQGGGYSSKGVYSPVQDCRMKSNQPKGFCPVCSREIERTIQFQIQ